MEDIMSETTKPIGIDTIDSIIKYFIDMIEQHIDKSKYKHMEFVLDNTVVSSSIKMVLRDTITDPTIILKIFTNLTYSILLQAFPRSQSTTNFTYGKLTYQLDSGSLADPDSCRKIIQKISEALDRFANGIQSDDVATLQIEYSQPIKRFATVRYIR